MDDLEPVTLMIDEDVLAEWIGDALDAGVIEMDGHPEEDIPAIAKLARENGHIDERVPDEAVHKMIRMAITLTCMEIRARQASMN